jgi:hypothetical protein
MAFSVDGNAKLSGMMPASVCGVMMTQLYADCTIVECTCCTYCCHDAMNDFEESSNATTNIDPNHYTNIAMNSTFDMICQNVGGSDDVGLSNDRRNMVIGMREPSLRLF